MSTVNQTTTQASQSNQNPTQFQPQSHSQPRPSQDLNQELQFFKTRFESTASPLIVFDPATATLDQAALATSLFLAFRNRSTNPTSSPQSIQSNPNSTPSPLPSSPTLLALSQPLVEHSALVGINQATLELPTEGLVITLDNSDNSIGNISCDADENNQQLKIYIKSQNNRSVLNPDKINFQPLTAEPDLIVAIGLTGLQPLRDLGLVHLSPQNTIFLQPAQLENTYAFDPIQANLTSSYSEFLAVLFRHWVWAISPDIATNLLMGIDQATANFSRPNLSPSAFEAAGWLLRQGGQRYLPELAAQQASQPVAPEAVPQFSGFAATEPPSYEKTSCAAADQIPAAPENKTLPVNNQTNSNPNSNNNNNRRRSRRPNHRPSKTNSSVNPQ